MKPLRCLLGFHDYTWTVTMTEPQFNWQECERCNHVEPEFRDQYERYQNQQSGEYER